MNPHELKKDIAAMPFFKGMNDRHIKVLAVCACRIHIEKDTTIFHQGETANRFYLIQDGTIELEASLKSDERSIVAGRIGRGGVLGWLREHCETDPSLGFELFERMGKEMVTRLQAARRRLLQTEAARFSPVGAEHAINSGV